MKRHAARTLLAVITAAACGSEVPVGPAHFACGMNPRALIRAVTAMAKWPTINDEFMTVATAESTFGGFFLDSTHLPVVYLTNASRLASARAAGLDAMLQARSIPSGTIRVRLAEYSFARLKQWDDLTQGSLWATPGLVFTSIDVVRNQLHYGVKTAAAESRVQQLLTAHGVPADAVMIELAAPFSFTARKAARRFAPGHLLADTSYLGDRIRPLAGGTEINRSPDSLTYCSLGFLGHTEGSSPDSQFFFSASHCGSFGSLNREMVGTTWYQSDTVRDQVIGTEIQDAPVFWGSGCYSGVFCSYADVFRGVVRSGVSATPGLLARTPSLERNITGHFYVTSEAASPVVGQTVWKEGATTGLTRGVVTSQCQNSDSVAYYHGEDVILLCTAEATDSVSDGDSGGPIFEWDETDSTVAVVGITSGQYSAGALLFTPIGQMHRAVGNFSVLSTTVFNPLTVSIDGPTVLPVTYPTYYPYIWTAEPNGGTGSYTYSWSYFKSPANTWYRSGTTQADTLEWRGTTTSGAYYRVAVTTTSGSQVARDTLTFVFDPSASISGPTGYCP